MKTKTNWKSGLLIGGVFLLLSLVTVQSAWAAGDSWETVGDSAYLADNDHGLSTLAFDPDNHDLYVAIVE